MNRTYLPTFNKILTVFTTLFDDKNTRDMFEAEPCKMRKLLMVNEIINSSWKDNKSLGIDNMKVEQLKHIHISYLKKLSTSKSAETRGKPTELIQGILILSQKETMFKYSTNTITLAICLINRITERIMKYIPQSQAVPGITEDVFAYNQASPKTYSRTN